MFFCFCVASVEKKTIMPLQDIAVLQTVIYRSGYSKVFGPSALQESRVILIYAWSRPEHSFYMLHLLPGNLAFWFFASLVQSPSLFLCPLSVQSNVMCYMWTVRMTFTCNLVTCVLPQYDLCGWLGIYCQQSVDKRRRRGCGLMVKAREMGLSGCCFKPRLGQQLISS